MGTISGLLGSAVFKATPELAEMGLKGGAKKVVENGVKSRLLSYAGISADNTAVKHLDTAVTSGKGVMRQQKLNAIRDKSFASVSDNVAGGTGKSHTGLPYNPLDFSRVSVKPGGNLLPSQTAQASSNKIIANTVPIKTQGMDLNQGAFYNPTTSIRPDTSNWQLGSRLL